MGSNTPSATAAADARPESQAGEERAHDPTLNANMDSALNAKEEPVDLADEEEAGDSEDRTGSLEGSIKRPRLRLSQAC